jgi:hypothetical protein
VEAAPPPEFRAFAALDHPPERAQHRVELLRRFGHRIHQGAHSRRPPQHGVHTTWDSRAVLLEGHPIEAMAKQLPCVAGY